MLNIIILLWINRDDFNLRLSDLICQRQMQFIVYVSFLVNVIFQIIKKTVPVSDYILYHDFQGVGLTGIVMMTELFPSGERTFAGTAFQIIWAVCWMLLALLGYLIRDWRYLMLTISLSSVFTIFYVWYSHLLLIDWLSHKSAFSASKAM